MKKRIFIYLLFFLCSSANAQEKLFGERGYEARYTPTEKDSLVVYVKDAQDNRPMPSAFIWLNKHKVGEAKGRYVTDSLGMVKISLAEKLRAVIIKSLGYHHAKIDRVFRGNNRGKWTLTVYMIPVQASFPNEIFYPRKKK